jgi:hypothetical protein
MLDPSPRMAMTRGIRLSPAPRWPAEREMLCLPSSWSILPHRPAPELADTSPLTAFARSRALQPLPWFFRSAWRLIVRVLFHRPRRDMSRAVRPSFGDPRFALLVAGQAVNSIGGWASAIVLWGLPPTGSMPARTPSQSPSFAGPPRPPCSARCWACTSTGSAQGRNGGWLLRCGLRRSRRGCCRVADRAGHRRSAYGGARALAGSAASALPPRIVAGEDLLAANALLGAAASAGQVAGPLAASAALALSGFPAAFIVDAASYLADAAVIAPLPLRPGPAPMPRATRSGWWRQLSEGFRLVTRDRAVRLVIAVSAAVTFTSAAFLVVEPLYARHVLHRPPSQFAPEPWAWPRSPSLPDSSAWPSSPHAQPATFPV